MSTTTPALIEEYARHVLTIMGFGGATLTCTSQSDGSMQVNIDAGSEGRLLIGAHGAHLAALQHLIRLVVRRASAAPVHLTVDVNGYRADRERTLQHMAEEAVREAHRTGRAIVLPPLPSPERRLIHTVLAERTNVRTESLGEEPNRRVVVRPTVI
jgi:spoIIIJ-associated protein